MINNNMRIKTKLGLIKRLISIRLYRLIIIVRPIVMIIIALIITM
jgi:hypothetical protein